MRPQTQPKFDASGLVGINVRSGQMPYVAKRIALALALFFGLCPQISLAFEPALTLPPEIAPLVMADDWPRPAAADEVETARLRAGLMCVGWARDMIDQHWQMLDRRDGDGSWTRERQNLWLQIAWIEEFETRYLRPRIDAASQAALMEVWWPEGVRTEAGSDEARWMHEFCVGLPGLLGRIDPASPYGF